MSEEPALKKQKLEVLRQNVDEAYLVFVELFWNPQTSSAKVPAQLESQLRLALDQFITVDDDSLIPSDEAESDSTQDKEEIDEDFKNSEDSESDSSEGSDVEEIPLKRQRLDDKE